MSSSSGSQKLTRRTDLGMGAGSIAAKQREACMCCSCAWLNVVQGTGNQGYPSKVKLTWGPESFDLFEDERQREVGRFLSKP